MSNVKKIASKRAVKTATVRKACRVAAPKMNYELFVDYDGMDSEVDGDLNETVGKTGKFIGGGYFFLNGRRDRQYAFKNEDNLYTAEKRVQEYAKKHKSIKIKVKSSVWADDVED
jgi:hypothetical protein